MKVQQDTTNMPKGTGKKKNLIRAAALAFALLSVFAVCANEIVMPVANEEKTMGEIIEKILRLPYDNLFLYPVVDNTLQMNNSTSL